MHTVFPGSRGACVTCGWPIKRIRNERGYVEFVHVPPVKKEAADGPR